MKPRTTSTGFTLVELAIVTAVVTLLLGGLLVTVSGQIDIQRTRETREILERVREALIGFSVANGRLPCPATAASNGQESYVGVVGATSCSGPAGNVVHGFVPGVTLGITPLDREGYVLDGWGFRMRYAVFVGTLNAGSPPTCNNTTNYANVFTIAGNMRLATMSCMAGTGVNPLLYVCASAAGTTTTDCGSAVLLTKKAPAVIYSTGKNSVTGGTGADEFENPNQNSGDTDVVFVSHDISAPGSPGGEFDDMMTWIALPVLFNRMIASGQLP
ncbi:MAG TPA: hypothetical protein VLC55_06490 [Burkholderiales bacterium]|nr:hypothetical protein [Burkholderiales bacterium]